MSDHLHGQAIRPNQVGSNSSLEPVKHSISKRLFFVALLPLVTQVLLFCGYAYLLQKSELLIKTQQRSADLLEHINWLSTQVSQKATFSMQYATTKDIEFLALKSAANKAIEREVGYLTFMTQPEPDQVLKQSISQAVEVAEKLGNTCEKLVLEIDKDKVSSHLPSLVCPSLKTHLREFNEAHQRIVSHQLNKLAILKAQVPKSLNQLYSLLYAGVLINLFFAALAIRSISFAITKRLSSLTQEARAITKLHLLQTPSNTKPEDEIDQLRTSFELMANALSTAIEKSKLEARTDSLSGMPNRRALLEDVEKYIFLAQRSSIQLAVAILDIDHFKKVNDTFGHDAGDCVIKTVAQVIREESRESDLVARWGGEEFIVIMPATDLANGIGFIKRLNQQIAAAKFEFNQDLKITISAGVTLYLPPNETFNKCLERADAALYQAKSDGRNRVCH